MYVEAQSAYGRATSTTDQPPTLLDVARASGFSKATVCKVATGNFFVSEVTREAIERAAAEIGYVWRRDQPRDVKRRVRRRTPRPAAEPKRSRITSHLHLVDLKAAIAVESMPRDDVVQYELEGVLPMADSGVASLADEDYDPTPVPTGCHDCWRRGCVIAGFQGVCVNCPAPPSKQEVRDEVKRQLPLTRLELRVAKHVALGLSTGEIAAQLGVDASGLAAALASVDG